MWLYQIVSLVCLRLTDNLENFAMPDGEPMYMYCTLNASIEPKSKIPNKSNRNHVFQELIVKTLHVGVWVLIVAAKKK